MLVIYAIRRKLTLLVLLNITCLLKCWDQARATEDGLLKPGRRRLLADAEGGEHLLASHDVEEMLHVETKSLNLLQPEGNNMNRKVGYIFVSYCYNLLLC